MKFSILIAHYNNFDYFKDCYKSIISQTFQDFEVIIVDDCSSKESFEKLEYFLKADPRFKLFRNAQNEGVGFTKSKCVDHASGEICGFVDPDDALVVNALEMSILAYGEKDVVATHSQFNLCDSELKILKVFGNTQKVKNSNQKFFNINFEVNHFFTFKKSAYNQTSGIDQKLTSAVDQDLYLKIYETGNLKYIKKPLYNYRLHEKGVSQEKSKKGKLNQNWHLVLKNTLDRRGIQLLFGKSVSQIENLPKFIFENENTFFARLKKKLK